MIGDCAADSPLLIVIRVRRVLHVDDVTRLDDSEEQINVVILLIDMINLQLRCARLRRRVVRDVPIAWVTGRRGCLYLVLIERR